MALDFTRKTIHDSGEEILAVSGTPDNLIIVGDTAPDNLYDFMLVFYKISSFIVDVGLYIKWDTPGVSCTELYFDFPIDGGLTDILPKIDVRNVGVIPITSLPNTYNIPVSPVREASFFENIRDPLKGISWLRYEDGVLQFYMKSDSPTNLLKVTSEFRYQLKVKPIFVIL